MTKRLRTSSLSKLQQYYIIRENNDLYNNNSSSSSDIRETKKLGILSKFKYQKEREIDIKTIRPSIDTINFPFQRDNNNFKLKRFFINEKEELLFNKSNDIHIYNIFIKDNKLYFREYIDINKNYYEAQIEKENGLFENQNGELISYDIEGYIIDSNGRNINTDKSVLCDNIDIDNYLFIDDNKNYYYINYDLYKEIFNLFKSIYNQNLILKLYKEKKLTSNEDIELFKENDEEEYIRELKNEKIRQEGGNTIKKYKKILKKYLKV